MTPLPTEAFFVGGPLDGKRVVLNQPKPIWYCFEFPQWGAAEDDSTLPFKIELLPLVREYRRAAVTPEGDIAIYRVEPLAERHTFTVEVSTALGADPEMVESVLSDLLTHIDGHVDSFIGGVQGARVVTD